MSASMTISFACHTILSSDSDVRYDVLIQTCHKTLWSGLKKVVCVSCECSNLLTWQSNILPLELQWSISSLMSDISQFMCPNSKFSLCSPYFLPLKYTDYTRGVLTKVWQITVWWLLQKYPLDTDTRYWPPALSIVIRRLNTINLL